MPRLGPYRTTSTTFVVCFVGLTLAVGAYGYFAVELTNYAELTPNPLTPEVQRRVAETYTAQSNHFSQWSLAILAGIIAVAVTAKVHRAKYVTLAYSLLGPAGAFILTSLRAGWQFQRRLANLVAFDDYSDLASLAQLLQHQTRLFLWGITLATLFGAWFLVTIVTGTTDPRS